MRAEVEVYRGIEFVRLSNLSREDARAIRGSGYGKKVIKILHGKEILQDCLTWSAYTEWYELSFPKNESSSSTSFAVKPDEVKLAL